MTFLNSILKNSKKYEFPFNHWEYNNALSEEAIKEVETKEKNRPIINNKLIIKKIDLSIFFHH